MKKQWLFIMAFILAGCAPSQYAPQATPPAQGKNPVENQFAALKTPLPTATPSPIPSATQNPFLEIYVSQTAVKLEEIRLAQQAQQLQSDRLAQDIRLTADAATSTVAASITQTQRADNLLAQAATAGVPGTQIAGTATAEAMTRVAKKDIQEYNASVFGIWLTNVFLLILLSAVMYGVYLAFRALNFRFSQMKPDENGRFSMVAESAIPGTTKRLLNPNLAHRVGVSVDDDDLSAEQALQNTAHARQLEGIRVIASSQSMSRKTLNSKTSEAKALTQSDSPANILELPLPEWSTWMQNWKPGYLALGINEKGLLQADPELNPHFLYAGTTGSWKTRGGARVLVTCALANGWQVVVAGKKLDYQVFENHPNAHMVPFSMLHEPTRAVDLLRNLYAEIERRDRMMSEGGYSLWSQTGRSRTVVVVDEFSNLADALEDIDRSKREDLWRWARMDAAEARKYGINLVFLLQDPTARSIDLRIRRNMSPIVFRVKDADSSRTILNISGAEVLPERHFLTSMIGMEHGAAFAPTDQDLLSFLESHPVEPLQSPDWIEAEVVEDVTQPNKDMKQDIDGQIRNTLLKMQAEGKVSLSQAQKDVFGDVNTGGSHFRQIQSIWQAMQAESTTTTPNMPDSGTVAA